MNIRTESEIRAYIDGYNAVVEQEKNNEKSRRNRDYYLLVDADEFMKVLEEDIPITDNPIEVMAEERMNNYIKREDAIAYPLSWDHYDKKNGNRHFIAGVESYREYIEELPIADVVEVVRCKDCEHWDMSWQNDNIPNHHYCPLTDGMQRCDFYCAYAERRGGQDEVLR